jgi:hypothetical protein
LLRVGGGGGWVGGGAAAPVEEEEEEEEEGRVRPWALPPPRVAGWSWAQ